jgi:hypothetical protein
MRSAISGVTPESAVSAAGGHHRMVVDLGLDPPAEIDLAHDRIAEDRPEAIGRQRRAG